MIYIEGTKHFMVTSTPVPGYRCACRVVLTDEFLLNCGKEALLDVMKGSVEPLIKEKFGDIDFSVEWEEIDMDPVFVEV